MQLFKRDEKPEPLLIVSLDNKTNDLNNRIKLHNKNLKRIFLHPNAIDRNLSILSFTGPTRSGKSFLINMCLRFLTRGKLESDLSDDKLTGFIWGPMPKDRSSGIYMWSEPILFERKDGAIAVILIDCQGAFDHNSTMQDNTVIFSISQLFSSIQFFNIFGPMNSEYLAYLTLFANFSKISNLKDAELTKEKEHLQKVFQKICIVIKNWEFAYDYPCGKSKEYIENFLRITDQTSDENRQTINFFVQQYQDIDCFLLPFPGKAVRVGKDFVGAWNDIDPDFQQELIAFANTYLSEDGLLLKEVMDRKVVGREMLVYAENYYNSVVSSKNPTPMTAFDACAKSNHYNTLNECLKYYETQMKNRGQYTDSAEIYLNYHLQCKTKALEKFQNIPKCGAETYSEKFYTELETQIDDEFMKFYQQVPVESISILPALKIMLISILILFVLYILAKITRLFQLELASNIIDIIIMIYTAIFIIYMIREAKHIYQRIDLSNQLQTAIFG